MSDVKQVYVSNYTSDGVNDEYFAYGLSAVDPSYSFVSLGKYTLTPGKDYTITSTFNIKFNTLPAAGLSIVIYAFANAMTSLSINANDNITTITKATYITDGVINVFPASGNLVSPNNCIVTAGAGFYRSGYIYQHTKDYTIVNGAIVFNTTIPANHTVSVTTFSSNLFDIKGGVSSKDNVVLVKRHDIVADGIKDTYTVTGGTSNRSNYCLVALNSRLLQGGVDFVVSHNRVKFIKVPTANANITIIMFGAAAPTAIPASLTNRVRYLDKSNNLNERTLYKNYWREQILHYGVTVNYYLNKTTKANADVVYGESPLAGYTEPEEINIIVRLDSETSLFSKFGYASDTEATGYIHHEDFQEIFGEGSEPKAGDLIELTEVGIDRLNYPKRGPRIMEITEKNDEVVAEINNLGGHYVWQVKMKRFDYSREKTIIPELGTADSVDTGETTPGMPNSINELSKKIFDYDKSQCSNDSVYGDY